jgi:hypothetical protein
MARSTVSRDADAERTGGVSLRPPEDAAAALATGPPAERACAAGAAGGGCWARVGGVDVAGWVGAAVVGTCVGGGADVGAVTGVGA